MDHSDVVALVLHSLPPPLIVRCGRVSRTWRAAATSEALWMRLAQSRGLVRAASTCSWRDAVLASDPQWRAWHVASVVSSLKALRRGGLASLRPADADQLQAIKFEVNALDAMLATSRGLERLKSAMAFQSVKKKRRARVESQLDRLANSIQIDAVSSLSSKGSSMMEVRASIALDVDGDALTVVHAVRRHDHYQVPNALFVLAHPLLLKVPREHAHALKSAMQWGGSFAPEGALALACSQFDETPVASLTAVKALRDALNVPDVPLIKLFSLLACLGDADSALAMYAEDELGEEEEWNEN